MSGSSRPTAPDQTVVVTSSSLNDGKPFTGVTTRSHAGGWYVRPTSHVLGLSPGKEVQTIDGEAELIPDEPARPFAVGQTYRLGTDDGPECTVLALVVAGILVAVDTEYGHHLMVVRGEDLVDDGGSTNGHQNQF